MAIVHIVSLCMSDDIFRNMGTLRVLQRDPAPFGGAMISNLIIASGPRWTL
jgi:hypothetical protein